MRADFQSRQPAPREGYVQVDNAELSYREIGHGRPIIVIHGGRILIELIYCPIWIGCDEFFASA